MLIPFQLSLKKTDTELVIVTVTEGLCDMITTLRNKTWMNKKKVDSLLQ